MDVLSDNVHYQKEACAKMKKDVSNVHLLENKRFKLPIAMQLWTDIIPCKQSPIRVMWAFLNGTTSGQIVYQVGRSCWEC